MPPAKHCKSVTLSIFIIAALAFRAYSCYYSIKSKIKNRESFQLKSTLVVFATTPAPAQGPTNQELQKAINAELRHTAEAPTRAEEIKQSFCANLEKLTTATQQANQSLTKSYKI